MSNASHVFVLDGAAAAPGSLGSLLGTVAGTAAASANGARPADGAAAAANSADAASADTLAWSGVSASRTLRRTWLDTFDWRLYRAGLTLEQQGTDGKVSLVLTGRDGNTLAEERGLDHRELRWPALVATLSAGPLRELLEPVCGVRALLPVARGVSNLGEVRALNGDDKTIARLTVDRMSVTFPARASVPPRLTLVPVRGYQGQTDRVSRALGHVPGIIAGQGSALDAALAAAGRPAGELPGKPGAVALTPAMPAAAGVAAILMSLLDSVEANVPGTARDIDTEFLHDLRIAVRWTRSALKLCGKALPGGLAGKFRPEFRWLGDLTTPTRDLDVYLLRLPGMTAGLVGATASDLVPFRDCLVAARATAHCQLARGLRSARFARLTAGWRTELAGVRQPRKRPTAGELAATKIAAANREALRTGQAISASSPPESLHDLRKRCKELRYLVEMFRSLHDPAEHWQAIRELKALQDCLGEFQDTEVQRTEIHAFAATMLAERRAPAETLLAMGEIAAGLAVRQRAARSEFDGRFAAFASPASQARLAGLAKAAA